MATTGPENVEILSPDVLTMSTFLFVYTQVQLVKIRLFLYIYSFNGNILQVIYKITLVLTFKYNMYDFLFSCILRRFVEVVYSQDSLAPFRPQGRLSLRAISSGKVVGGLTSPLRRLEQLAFGVFKTIIFLVSTIAIIMYCKKKKKIIFNLIQIRNKILKKYFAAKKVMLLDTYLINA